MNPVTDKEIRASFVNCSKGEAKRANLPRGLHEVPWDDLDFLGWRDPGALDRGYIVAERDSGLVGVTLRAASGVRRSLAKSNICSLCSTAHAGTGVVLYTARRVGAAGRQGNTVGAYVCGDLACSLYVRGKKKNAAAERYLEGVPVEDQIADTVLNLEQFLHRILDPTAGS
ncbi:FBP domain-containing protein [Nocardiopsis gilva YIM 90087]|uniref:FBP domain-containing protein n=1 Tax=Nocardiopsis gilva YIM 90087 TaxID=1235441 RepID=A0A223SAV3_9ACTN|nr:FBP domain-containing protein [Nocardiopsis gilva]ASU85215.1 FBP domain-containing protein [Nocardiopsis gilva YIM 90087]